MSVSSPYSICYKIVPTFYRIATELYYEQHENQTCISAVTRGDLIYGAERSFQPKRNLADIKGLFCLFFKDELLENFVFVELKRKGLDIEYHRAENGLEMDFIATNQRDSQTVYQVSLELRDEQTREKAMRITSEVVR